MEPGVTTQLSDQVGLEMVVADNQLIMTRCLAYNIIVLIHPPWRLWNCSPHTQAVLHQSAGDGSSRGGLGHGTNMSVAQPWEIEVI